MADSKSVDTSTVDREKLCPFLLRMYYNLNAWHRVDQFSLTSTPSAQEELQLYTWKNATLGEIADLVQKAIPEVINKSPQAQQLFATPGATRSRTTEPKHIRLMFRILSLDQNRAAYVARDVGTVYLEPEIPSPSPSASPQRKQSTANIHNQQDIQWSLSANQPSKALDKTLESISFVIGDYIDIAIVTLAGDPMRGSSGRPSGIDSGGAGPIHGGGGGGGGRDRRGGRSGRDRDRRRNRDRERERERERNNGVGKGRADRFAGRLGALNPDLDGDWKRAQRENQSRR